MSPLHIKRQRNTNVDPKQVLRAHVNQLPMEKQQAFIASAFQLIAARDGTNEAKIRSVVTPDLSPKGTAGHFFTR